MESPSERDEKLKAFGKLLGNWRRNLNARENPKDPKGEMIAMSKQQAGRALGISTTMYRKAERALAPLPLRAARVLAGLLGYSIPQLLTMLPDQLKRGPKTRDERDLVDSGRLELHLKSKAIMRRWINTSKTKFSANRLADEMKCSSTYIYDLLQGEKMPSVATIEKIAGILKCNPREYYIVRAQLDVHPSIWKEIRGSLK